MNEIIHRESASMKDFSARAEEIAGKLEVSVSRLTRMIPDAEDHIQDESGKKAIEIISGLLAETQNGIRNLYYMADQVRESARLLEESDLLL